MHARTQQPSPWPGWVGYAMTLVDTPGLASARPKLANAFHHSHTREMMRPSPTIGAAKKSQCWCSWPRSQDADMHARALRADAHTCILYGARVGRCKTVAGKGQPLAGRGLRLMFIHQGCNGLSCSVVSGSLVRSCGREAEWVGAYCACSGCVEKSLWPMWTGLWRGWRVSFVLACSLCVSACGKW